MLAKLGTKRLSAKEGSKAGYSENSLELAEAISTGEFPIFVKIFDRLDALKESVESAKIDSVSIRILDGVESAISSFRSELIGISAQLNAASCDPAMFEGPSSPVGAGLNTIAGMIKRRDVKIDTSSLTAGNWDTTLPADVAEALERIADRLVNGGAGPL
jgi:hypothetical protein